MGRHPWRPAAEGKRAMSGSRVGAGGDGTIGRGGEAEALEGIRSLEFCPGHFRGMVAASIWRNRRRGDQGGTLPMAIRSASWRPRKFLVAGQGSPSSPRRANRRFVTLDCRRSRRSGRLPAPRPLRGRDHHDGAAGAHGGDGCETTPPCGENDRGSSTSPFPRTARSAPTPPAPCGNSDILCQRSPGPRTSSGSRNGRVFRPCRMKPLPVSGTGRGIRPGAVGSLTGFSRPSYFRAGPGRARPSILRAPSLLMMFRGLQHHLDAQGGRRASGSELSTPPSFPYTYIRCRDGYTSSRLQRRGVRFLMHIIGRPELSRDPRFSTPKNRVASRTSGRSFRSSRSGPAIARRTRSSGRSRSTPRSGAAPPPPWSRGG